MLHKICYRLEFTKILPQGGFFLLLFDRWCAHVLKMMILNSHEIVIFFQENDSAFIRMSYC